jgi:hypothetical protein
MALAPQRSVRCFCCFCSEITAIGIASAAEILSRDGWISAVQQQIHAVPLLFIR